MSIDLLPQVLVQRTKSHTMSDQSSVSSAEETTQSLCINLPFHQCNRRYIMKPPNRNIIPCSEHEHPTIYSNTPIHSTSNHECSVRKKGKHMYMYQEIDRPNTDHKAVAAKRPSPRRQGFPRMRFSKTLPTEIMNEVSTLTAVREMMALRATEEPMLINESAMVTKRETRTALRVIFQPGVTYAG